MFGGGICLMPLLTRTLRKPPGNLYGTASYLHYFFNIPLFSELRSCKHAFLIPISPAFMSLNISPQSAVWKLMRLEAYWSLFQWVKWAELEGQHLLFARQRHPESSGYLLSIRHLDVLIVFAHVIIGVSALPTLKKPCRQQRIHLAQREGRAHTNLSLEILQDWVLLFSAMHLIGSLQFFTRSLH